jgi:chromosome segregation ATPase
MGFLDKLKQEASDVASTVAEKTQEVAKVGQLHVQLRNLNGEERDALNEFGREAYNLHEANALAERSGELAASAAKIADLRAQIAAKEQEIAALRSDGQSEAAASDTVESSAEEVPEPPAADEPGAADAPSDGGTTA